MSSYSGGRNGGGRSNGGRNGGGRNTSYQGRGEEIVAASGRGGGGRGGVSEHTIREEMKISFTKQLTRLREDTVDKVVFPSTLTNIERKFLHKLSEELGLKSKSHGKEGVDQGRQITVTKPSVAMAEATKAAAASGNNRNNSSSIDLAMPIFTLNPRSFDILSSCFSSSSSCSVQGPPPSICIKTPTTTTTDRVYKATTLHADAAMLKNNYHIAQEKRDKKLEYQKMRGKRETLPAFQHEEDVCRLVQQNQVVLISGGE